MSEFERGPLTPYQVSWRSGYVETIHAHQVIWPNGGVFGEPEAHPRVMVHGEVDGHWKLLLIADEADILSIRALAAKDVA